ncbi:MAG TPA: tetratricopeptide repeat protein [Gemmatimonadaceae bacterium]|nr:tetratricopeptide repeat protein [Gemmatimonadaceae bacterium]
MARASGLGDQPDDVLQWRDREVGVAGTETETPFLADVLRWEGSVRRDRGRTSDAEPFYHRSLAIATRLGYEAGCAHALNCLASLAQRRGDILGTGNLLTDALARADRSGEKRLVGMVQQNLGIIADIRGNPAAALAHYRLSLRIFDAIHDLQASSWVLNNLGYLHVKEGRYADAREAFDRALEIAQTRGDLMSEGIIEENRAELGLILGRTTEAYASVCRALEIAELRGDGIRRAAALKQRGAYERLMGRPADAVESLRVAMTLSAVGEDALLGAETLYQYGLALYATGDNEGAADVWKSALDAFERIAAHQWVGRVRQRLSRGGTSRYL